jgi:hypothetical protein
MYNSIRTVPGCAQRLNACHTIVDSRQRVYRFVSDDYWGSAEQSRCVVPFITQYLMDAWGLRIQCKYGSDRITALGVVVSASEMGRGADGRSAMADG